MPTDATTAMNFGDFWALAPEIGLTVLGLVVLMVDFGLLREAPGPRRRRLLGALTLVGTLAVLLYQAWPLVAGALPGRAAGSTGSAAAVPDPVLFFGTLANDPATIQLNALLVLLLVPVVGLSMAWEFTEHWGEYFALLLWATVGMMLLIASEELLTLFLTLEMMTLCLYLLTSFEKSRRRSAEGGLKYFVYGSVSSALFLFGLSLVYGLTGSTRLPAVAQALAPAGGGVAGLEGNLAGATAVLLILVGFGFKVAAVPFHQWAPDAYEGAPAPVTAWIAVGSKLASFVALMKVLLYGLGAWSRSPGDLLGPGWIGLVALIAAVTMTYGNLAALAQRNLKRMLAYSSIAHAGYMLVGVLAASVSTRRDEAAGSVLFYLVVYGVSNVGAFAVAAWLARDLDRDDIEDLDGLGRRSPALAACIVVLMLSLIGLPPLAGFFGKLYMFMEALEAGERGRLALLWLVALGLANSVVSAFYYVRVLKAMFLRDPGRRPLGPAPRGVSWPILLATFVVVLFGLYPTPLLEQMRGLALPMLSPGAHLPTTAPVAQAPPPPISASPR